MFSVRSSGRMIFRFEREDPFHSREVFCSWLLELKALNSNAGSREHLFTVALKFETLNRLRMELRSN